MLNENIYIVTDNIQTAIITKKKVVFQYFDYDLTGKQLPRHNGELYYVTPYDLIWSNDTYYLAGYNVAEFFTHEFSMFDGDDCEVTLLCENALMNSVVDRFGNKVKTVAVDDTHFKVTVTVDLSSIFYGWVFASEGRMKILSPQKAVDGFVNIIEKNTRA